MDSLYLRYVNALLSLAKEENKVNEYKLALISLSIYLNDNSDIKKYLESYLVDKNEKEKIVNVLTKDYKLTYLNNFLLILIKNHRFHDFNKFVNEYKKVANIELDILSGNIYSVNYLTKEDINKFELSLSNKLHKKVELENRLDSSLIGGIKIMINDHIYDGSIKGKIDKMKEQLKERGSLWK